MAPRGVNRDSVKTGCLQTRYRVPSSPPAEATLSAWRLSQKATIKGGNQQNFLIEFQALTSGRREESCVLCGVCNV